MRLEQLALFSQNAISAIRRIVRAGGIAGLTNAVGIVVVIAGITKFTIGDFVVPTIRCILAGKGVSCAIVLGIPGLSGAIEIVINPNLSCKLKVLDLDTGGFLAAGHT